MSTTIYNEERDPKKKIVITRFAAGSKSKHGIGYEIAFVEGISHSSITFNESEEIIKALKESNDEYRDKCLLEPNDTSTIGEPLHEMCCGCGFALIRCPAMTKSEFEKHPCKKVSKVKINGNITGLFHNGNLEKAMKEIKKDYPDAELYRGDNMVKECPIVWKKEDGVYPCAFLGDRKYCNYNAPCKSCIDIHMGRYYKSLSLVSGGIKCPECGDITEITHGQLEKGCLPLCMKCNEKHMEMESLSLHIRGDI